MGTPKGGKGYDRKREREEIEREIESDKEGGELQAAARRAVAIHEFALRRGAAGSKPPARHSGGKPHALHCAGRAHQD